MDYIDTSDKDCIIYVIKNRVMKTKRKKRIKCTRKQKGGQLLHVSYSNHEVKGQSFTEEETNQPPQVRLPQTNGILVMWDPDAMGGYVHWILPFRNGTPESPILPYKGPTPPSGTHRYYFDIVPYHTNLKNVTSRTPFSLNLSKTNHQEMTVSSSS